MSIVSHGLGRSGSPQSTQGLGGKSIPRGPDACVSLNFEGEAAFQIDLLDDVLANIDLLEDATATLYLKERC